MKKLVKILSLVLILVLAITPAMKVEAVPPTHIHSWECTEQEIENNGLSGGGIGWTDDLVCKSLVVCPKNDGRYEILCFEDILINDLPDVPPDEETRRNAQCGFIGIYNHAQSKGWYDCRWKITCRSRDWVIAHARLKKWVVDPNDKPSVLDVTQVTAETKDGWKSFFAIGDGNVYTSDELMNLIF